MKNTLTGKGKAVVKYFLLNGNTPTYQKRIAENAGISEQHLGTGGLLAKLEEEGILDLIVSKVRQRGITNHYFLKEDPATFQKIAYEFLKDKDIAYIFIQSEYTQSMIKEHFDSILEYMGLSVKDEHKEKLLLMLRLSPAVFKRIIEIYNYRKQYEERLLEQYSKSKNRDTIIKNIVPAYTFSDHDINEYEYEFFRNLTNDPYSLEYNQSLDYHHYSYYSKLPDDTPLEKIIEVFGLKEDEEGKYCHRVVASSTFAIGKCKNILPSENLCAGGGWGEDAWVIYRGE